MSESNENSAEQDDAAQREILSGGNQHAEGVNVTMEPKVKITENQQQAEENINQLFAPNITGPYNVQTSAKAMLTGFIKRDSDAINYWREFSGPWKKTVAHERSLEECQTVLDTIASWEEGAKNIEFFHKEDQTLLNKLQKRLNTITELKTRVQEVQVLKEFTQGINIVSSDYKKWHEVHLQLQKDMQNGVDTSIAECINPEQYERFAKNLAEVKRTYKKLTKSETFPMEKTQKEDFELRIRQATAIQRTIVVASSKQIAEEAPKTESAYGVNVGQIESNNAKQMQEYYQLLKKHGSSKSRQLINDFRSLQKERKSAGPISKTGRWFTKNIFRTKQSKEVEDYYTRCKEAYEAYKVDKPRMQELKKSAEHYQANFSFKRPSAGYSDLGLAA